MATDTDEKDKPEPACKKQRLVANMHQQQSSSNTSQNNPQSLVLEGQETAVHKQEDRREKLRCWQACQVAQGFVNNTINSVLENYRKSPPSSHRFEDPWYCLLRGNQMEDTAVSMAIRNHGLVPSLDLIPFCPLMNEEVSDVPECNVDVQKFATANSSETLVLTDSEAANTSGEGDSLDDKYDSDHQQNFLDRAVAEAIKKKGLSTLNVDYG